MGRRAIVLLVALILAGLAAWAVWNFLDGVRADVEADQEKVTVFRAGEGGIAEGTEGSVLVTDYNAGGSLVVGGEDEFEDTPADAIQTEDELRSVLTGSVAAGPISEKGILTRSQWTTVSVETTPLAELIGTGNQAVTISTSNIQGVNGFVEAGDRVNMIVTLDIEFDFIPVEGLPTVDPGTTGTTVPGEEQSETVTYTRYVLQGLPVMAVGRDIRVEDDGDQTGEITSDNNVTVEAGTEGAPAEDLGNSTIFTLEVTPDQAERIVYAFENGSIWLTLVPEDFVEVETDGVTINNLFGGDLLEAILDTVDN